MASKENFFKAHWDWLAMGGGIAVLIDDRYAEPKYRELFPKEWKDSKLVGDAPSLAEIARRFWQK